MRTRRPERDPTATISSWIERTHGGSLVEDRFIDIAVIGENRTALRLQDGPTDEPPLDAMTRFVTTHQRNGDGIELRHALLPFVRAGS